MLKKDFGDRGEKTAAEEYKRLGYKLLAQNVKILSYKQVGEIDLILKKGKEIIFVEVKARSSENFMPAVEAVGYRKQTKLLKAIKAYLAGHPEFDKYKKRIDVAVVKADLDGQNGRAIIIEDAIQDTA